MVRRIKAHMKDTDVVNGETGVMIRRDGSEIRVGSSAWFDRVDNWNGTPDRFYYQLDEMIFTANVQTRRNKKYWYAFRQLDGRRLNHYLCSMRYDLTLDRLADAAKWLHAKMHGVEPDGDTLLQWRCRKCGQRFFGTVSDLPTRCASSECRGDVTTWYPIGNSDTTGEPSAARSERVEPVELSNSDTAPEPAADPLDVATPDAVALADGVQTEPMHGSLFRRRPIPENQIKNALAYMALQAKFRVRKDARTLVYLEMQKRGLVRAVSGKQMITYELTDAGKRAVLALTENDTGGFFPNINDIRRAQKLVSASVASSEHAEPVEPTDDEKSEPMHDLNERQLFYLQAIYQLDQIQESYQRRKSAERFDRTPAKIWRRVWYDNNPAVGGMMRTELYNRLHAAGYVDPGTGSTFKALADRGLIDRHWSSYSDGTLALAVTITRAGRALIRSITDTPAPKKRPAGQLKLRQWEALAAVYSAYPDAVYGHAGNYGGFSWQWTWLRLRDYPHKFGGALIVETSKNHQNGMKITDAGRRFYETRYDEYKTLYPDAVAPLPSDEK